MIVFVRFISKFNALEKIILILDQTINGIQNKKISNDEIISQVVSLVEKKETEILSKK